MSRSAALPYRPDIDGLRAIAVLSVVLFHIDRDWLPGGFTGVDLFFVISGYLISSILMSDLRAGKFSFRTFYAHRVRRIFPALILVLATSWIAGWLILFPEEFRLLCKHIAGATVFIPNIVLWKESGYFDEAADLKPLLHLWSLGVEEQFYFLWPPILLWAWRAKLPLGKVVAVLALASFAVNLARVEEHGASTFFLPHTRFWELLIGVGLAVRPLPTLARLPANACSATGIALIAAGFLWLDGAQLYPGWRAILPAMGAALLIAAGPEAAVNRILSQRPVVWFGLISYPLYLWHWPLFAFARIMGHGDSATLSVLGLMAIALAWLTYRFIEYPLRHRLEPVAQRRWIRRCCLMLVAIAAVSFTCSKLDGLPKLRGFTDPRFGDMVGFTEYRESFAECGRNDAEKIGWCFTAREAEPVDAVLYGDSHADHLFPALAANDKQRNWMLLGRSACPPLKDVNVIRHNLPSDCIDANRAAMRIILGDPAIRTVLVGMVMPYYIAEEGFAPQHREPGSTPTDINLKAALPQEASLSEADLMRRGLERTVAELEAAGKKVVLALDIPEVNFMPISCFTRSVGIRHAHGERKGCSVAESRIRERQAESRAIVAEIQQRHPKLRVFDPLPFLCKHGQCIVADADMLYYRDSHHLSYRGSQYLSKPLIGWLNERQQ